MHLERANALQLQFVRGSTEIAAELRNRADVGSLCRWRKIADGHVLDHAVAQRAHLGHLEICNTRSSQTGGQLSDLAARAAIAASFNLEASVRSPRRAIDVFRGRDLIEAGLNEAAGGMSARG